MGHLLKMGALTYPGDTHAGKKKQLLASASSVFEGKHAKTEATVDLDALYKKIGRLEMERDFLASRPGVIAHLFRDEIDRAYLAHPESGSPQISLPAKEAEH